MNRSTVPTLRLRAANDPPARPDGDFVLYWMVMYRRTTYNFALQRAVEWAREVGRPLLVLEALRAGYPWASDRFHRFAIDAMADNAAALARAGVRHHPYVEPKPGAGKGLLEALAERACVVVTDEYPDFFLPRMLAAAARKLPARLEVVDSAGLLPLRAAPRAFTHSHHFRRWYQGELPAHLAEAPDAEPLRRLPEAAPARIPRAVLERWPAAPAALLRGDAGTLDALPIDHEVPPVHFRGGPVHGARVLASFLRERLPRYRAEKNEPEAAVTSGLSPYLHWGFVSPHQVLAGVAGAEGWTPERVALRPTGKREGWWGVGPEAEAFLDELVTWRELSYNTAHFVEGHDRYDTLPQWALRTLEKHAGDARPALLSRDAMELGHSPDALWNATQGQLRTDGRIHNYMRIVWGKRFLEWTRTPRDAAEWMLHVNNRWALDGRNPNSVSGIMWTLGRYDRAWGPERPVYGTVRYVSSGNTARKVRVREYVRRYTPPAE